MIGWLIRRFFYALLTFFGITIATFALIHSIPGDPISFFVGRAGASGVSAEVLEGIRQRHHLDEPLPVQYLHWVTSVATFDFGTSIVDRRTVRAHVAETLPNTFILNLAAFLVAALIGVPIGLWSAAHSGRFAERVSAVGFFLLYSLPSFWVALLLMQWLAVRLDVLPLFGMTSNEFHRMSPGEQLVDRLRHMVLPVLCLTYTQLAIFARFTKASLTEVIRQDFITAARARGAGPAAVLWRHALRNALMPMVTLLGLTIPYLISGSVIVEQIFQWNGIGHLYMRSILARDYPVIMGLTVVTAIVTLLASILADVLYAVVDPRVRLEGSR